MSYSIRRDRVRKKLLLQPGLRKCLHTYRLRLLRAHRLVRKVPHANRYQLTVKGRQIITAILQTQEPSLATLTEPAA